MKYMTHLKIAAAALLAAVCLLLSGCSVQELSSLHEFAKPWQGAYVCEEARWGDEDVLPRLREIIVDLGEGGVFTADVCLRSGKKIRARGNYEYDEATGDLTFSLTYGGETHRAVSHMQEGKFTLSKQFCGRAAVFRFKIMA